MSNLKFTDEELVEAVGGGLTYRQLAEKFGCSQGGIYGRMKKLGLSTTTGGGIDWDTIGPQAIRLHNEGHSNKWIASLLGISHWSVGYYLDRNKLAVKRDKKNNGLPSQVTVLVNDRDITLTGSGRFIVTNHQVGGEFHEPFYDSLVNYAEQHYAPLHIMCGGYASDIKTQEVPELAKRHLVSHNINVGELRVVNNVLVSPTSNTPLGCLSGVVDAKDVVLPHPTVELRVAPNALRGEFFEEEDILRYRKPQILQTTGSISRPASRTTRSGFIADTRWRPTALVVEYDTEPNGHVRTWCRHLVGDPEDGSFHDLGYRYDHIGMERFAVKVLVSGDLHTYKIDNIMCNAKWGVDSNFMRFLSPHIHVMHDVFDGISVSRHEIYNDLKAHVNQTSLEEELRQTYRVVAGTIARGHPQTHHVVIHSNHDEWLYNFVVSKKSAVHVRNLETYHQLALKAIECERQDEREKILPKIWRGVFGYDIPGNLSFLADGAGDPVAGVNHSFHGHRGPNGGAGSLMGFNRMAVPVTIAHSHVPGIYGKVHQVGTTSKLDMGYNRGASSWLHADGLTYDSGARTLLIADGRHYYHPDWDRATD